MGRARPLALRKGWALFLALIFATPTAAREPARATLWMQASAEYRVLVRQVFDQARRSLASALTASPEAGALENLIDTESRSPAVILDIDETVLDNGPARALGILRGEPGFDPVAWKLWVLSYKAPALPGALEYVRDARALGIRVFYVTNRTCSSPTVCPQEEATIRNLIDLGFSRIDDRSLMLRREEPGWTGEKASRRSAVARDFRIVQLVGDDLGDFIPGMRSSDPETRLRLVEQYQERFGRTWFLLPNPAYGSWLESLGDSPMSHLEPDLDQLCLGPLTPIRHLIGLDGPSHCAGLTVTARGVVSRILEGDHPGFYLRDPDSPGDGESAPEILVRVPMGPDGMAVGQLIEVRTRVVDRDGQTLLEPSGSGAIRVLDSAAPGLVPPPGSTP